MDKWKIPLYRIESSKNDYQGISKVIKRKSDWAIGPEIEKFEEKLSKYLKTDYCVSFNSGTSAQHAALLALDIKPNFEIIVPSFTFISTPNSVLMINAKPVFSDIETKSLGLDPNLLQKKISKKTKAIMPIHYSGGACEIEEILKISNKNKIHLIEDAAESLGCKIGTKKVGTYGLIGIFSFAANKIITSGEGGALVTNSKKVFEKLKLIRSHGRLDKEKYFQSNLKPNYISLGFNWRMSSITAALALSQLNRIESIISKRRKNAQYFSQRLNEINEISLPFEDGFRHVYQMYSIRVKNKLIRNSLMKYLSKNGIMTKIYFDSVHKTPYYNKLGYSKISLPNTDLISNQILSLPIFANMKNYEMKKIVDVIEDFFRTK